MCLIGSGKGMRAFDIAVGSMKVAELAEFTIHSDYAYGPRGGKINDVEIPEEEEITMEVSKQHYMKKGHFMTRLKLLKIICT